MTNTLRRIFRRAAVWSCNAVAGPVFGKHCPACGQRTLLRQAARLHPGLVRDWQLSPEQARQFDEREFRYCMACHATERDRGLAGQIVAWANRRFDAKLASLGELAAFGPFRQLRIAEINSIGRLHKWFANHPNLSYSEYGSTDPAVPDENMLALSYADQTFDLVLTSETFEHIPDFPAAQKELHRVLKPGGTHLFTIPVVWDRPTTLQRASVAEGKLIHHVAPSYHGDYDSARDDFIVFYEFGSDVVGLIEQAGFEVVVHRHATNPALAVFEAVRKA